MLSSIFKLLANLWLNFFQMSFRGEIYQKNIKELFASSSSLMPIPMPVLSLSYASRMPVLCLCYANTTRGRWVWGQARLTIAFTHKRYAFFRGHFAQGLYAFNTNIFRIWSSSHSDRNYTEHNNWTDISVDRTIWGHRLSNIAQPLKHRMWVNVVTNTGNSPVLCYSALSCLILSCPLIF